jgi:hypothetical protein
MSHHQNDIHTNNDLEFIEAVQNSIRKRITEGFTTQEAVEMLRKELRNAENLAVDGEWTAQGFQGQSGYHRLRWRLP